jgi:hypothetical protein
MPSKEQAHSSDKADSKQQSPKLAKDFDAVDEPQILPSPIIQRATLDPGRLTPHDVLQLQGAIGNRAVSTLLTKTGLRPAVQPARPQIKETVQTTDRVQRYRDDELPSIAHLSATSQALLQGVMKKGSIDEAVRQIYDNMWNYGLANWKYNASIVNVNGKTFIEGTANAGMCESYREAFYEILQVFNNLRKTHPDPAISGGALNIEKGQDLVAARFMTRTGLTLMGATALKGNVYLETDGQGAIQAQGEDAVNRFVFMGHWTLKVNGVEYDPIFKSINEANVAELFDSHYESDAAKAIVDTSRPIPTGEFGATFILVSDKDGYYAAKNNLFDFYQKNHAQIDWLAGSKWYQRWKKGIFRQKNAKIVKDCKAIVQRNISDTETFLKLVRMDRQATRAQIKAVEAVVELAKRG